METKLGLNINSHNLIEYFMIETNKYIGELLYKKFGSKNGSTFYNDRDKTKRKKWIARHSKI